MRKNQTTLAVTQTEKQILEKAKGFYEEMLTGGKPISWGLFFVTLSLGVLSAREIEGFSITCPWCEKTIAAQFVRGAKSGGNGSNSEIHSR